jgi:hypothetical protein
MKYRTRPIAAAVPSAGTAKPVRSPTAPEANSVAERDHPSSRDPYPVSDDLDRLGADEVQGGGISVRERRQDRGSEVGDVHTS